MEFEIVESINPRSWQDERQEAQSQRPPQQRKRVPDTRQSAFLIPESEECLCAQH
ncbi:hypothetical protein [Novosphingobium cyanobacteriorum]|nr:hypothetical protein [Novosphingobium cyanobacteriorum]